MARDRSLAHQSPGHRENPSLCVVQAVFHHFVRGHRPVFDLVALSTRYEASEKKSFHQLAPAVRDATQVGREVCSGALQRVDRGLDHPCLPSSVNTVPLETCEGETIFVS